MCAFWNRDKTPPPDEVVLDRLAQATKKDEMSVEERRAAAGKALKSISAEEKPATQAPLRKSNLEQAIDDGTLSPVDRTQG